MSAVPSLDTPGTRATMFKALNSLHFYANPWTLFTYRLYSRVSTYFTASVFTAGSYTVWGAHLPKSLGRRQSPSPGMPRSLSQCLGIWVLPKQAVMCKMVVCTNGKMVLSWACNKATAGFYFSYKWVTCFLDCITWHSVGIKNRLKKLYIVPKCDPEWQKHSHISDYTASLGSAPGKFIH